MAEIREMAHESRYGLAGRGDRPGDPIALTKTPSWRECCDREEHDRQNVSLHSENRARCARGESSASAAETRRRLHAGCFAGICVYSTGDRGLVRLRACEGSGLADPSPAPRTQHLPFNCELKSAPRNEPGVSSDGSRKSSKLLP